MYYIGIDLGGTNIAAGIVDDQYKIVAKGSVPTAMPRSAQEIVDDMGKLVCKLIEEAGIKKQDVRSVGIGTPGTANSKTGVVEFAANLNFQNVPLASMLEKIINLPVVIENDANAAAYGEYVAGAASGCSSAVVITLGTGVGSGIIVDGKIVNGCNYAAGEFGHVVIVYDGLPCNCGRKGCWEAYSSATGLIHMTADAMDADKTSTLWELCGGDKKNINGKTAFDAMRAGDKTGGEVVHKFISYLGCGLANVINIFQPDVLCIGGGICKEGETLLAPLRDIMERETFNSKNSKKKTRLCTAKLGNDAGIIGAALLGNAK